MKIQSKTLILITKSNFGGAQKYALNQAIRAKKGSQDVLVAFGGNDKLTNHLIENQIPYLSLLDLKKEIDFKKDFRVLRQLIKLYKTEKPTEIHLHSSKMGFLGSLAGFIYRFTSFRKSKKVSLYFTVHGWVFNEDLRRSKKFLYKLISYWTIINCRKVFVLSQFEFDQVRKWPRVKNKLEIKKLEIGNLQHEFIPKENARDYFAKNLGLNKNKKWIVTIAEINDNKNLQLGIKAFKKIKEENSEDFIWIIIGDGEKENQILKIVEKYDLNSQIFMYGYLKDAYKYLKAFDLFLLTSKKEGLPYVLLEAEQAGLDIISTKVGGIQEYFENKNNILIESENQSELEEALIEKLNFG